MAKFQLDASVREVTGKEVKKMRREGQIPAVLYGPKVETPINLVLPERELGRLLMVAGGDNNIDLNVDGTTYVVRAHTVDRHITRNDILHVDFLTV